MVTAGTVFLILTVLRPVESVFVCEGCSRSLVRSPLGCSGEARRRHGPRHTAFAQAIHCAVFGGLAFNSGRQRLCAPRLYASSRPRLAHGSDGGSSSRRGVQAAAAPLPHPSAVFDNAWDDIGLALLGWHLGFRSTGRKRHSVHLPRSAFVLSGMLRRTAVCHLLSHAPRASPVRWRMTSGTGQPPIPWAGRRDALGLLLGSFGQNGSAGRPHADSAGVTSCPHGGVGHSEFHVLAIRA